MKCLAKNFRACKWWKVCFFLRLLVYRFHNSAQGDKSEIWILDLVGQILPDVISHPSHQPFLLKIPQIVEGFFSSRGFVQPAPSVWNALPPLFTWMSLFLRTELRTTFFWKHSLVCTPAGCATPYISVEHVCAYFLHKSPVPWEPRLLTVTAAFSEPGAGAGASLGNGPPPSLPWEHTWFNLDFTPHRISYSLGLEAGTFPFESFLDDYKVHSWW